MEESISGVHVVLDYAGCFPEAAGSVDSVNGWEVGLSNGLGFVHDPLKFIVVLDRAGAIPSCAATRKDALYGTFVMLVRGGADMPIFLNFLRKWRLSEG